MLASLLYPYDTDAPSLIEGWLDELERETHICRYEIDGHTYLEVVNFLEHQKIDRPSKSKLPASASLREDSTSPREELLRIKEGIKDQGRDQGGDQGSGIEDPAAKPREANGSDTSDTRILSESVGIYGMREQADMHRLLAVYMKESGRNVVESVGIMIARWQEYQSAMPSLEYTYGSSHKFFMSGNWNQPENWPRKVTKPSERERRRLEFQNAATEDGS